LVQISIVAQHTDNEGYNPQNSEPEPTSTTTKAPVYEELMPSLLPFSTNEEEPATFDMVHSSEEDVITTASVDSATVSDHYLNEKADSSESMLFQHATASLQPEKSSEEFRLWEDFFDISAPVGFQVATPHNATVSVTGESSSEEHSSESQSSLPATPIQPVRTKIALVLKRAEKQTKAGVNIEEKENDANSQNANIVSEEIDPPKVEGNRSPPKPIVSSGLPLMVPSPPRSTTRTTKRKYTNSNLKPRKLFVTKKNTKDAQ